MDQLQHRVVDPLKPYLLPVTTNLPKPINDVILSLLGDPCHSALLRDLDVTNTQCVGLAVSKALGIAIVTTASVVKVPQMLKLLSSKSAQGVSLTSYLLESTSFLITLAYNVRNGFPFSTYGELAMILMQNIVITVLICLYTKKTPQAGAFLAAIVSSIYALIISDTLVNDQQMSNLQGAAGLLSVASKIPPILAVYREGGTGQLSAFAVFNYLLGSLSRIFTTLQEVPDQMILYGFVAGFVLNAVLAAQMVYYWNSPKTAEHAKEMDPKRKVIGGIGQDFTAGLRTEEKQAISTARPSSSTGRRKG